MRCPQDLLPRLSAGHVLTSTRKRVSAQGVSQTLTGQAAPAVTRGITTLLEHANSVESVSAIGSATNVVHPRKPSSLAMARNVFPSCTFVQTAPMMAKMCSVSHVWAAASMNSRPSLGASTSTMTLTIVAVQGAPLRRLMELEVGVPALAICGTSTRLLSVATASARGNVVTAVQRQRLSTKKRTCPCTAQNGTHAPLVWNDHPTWTSASSAFWSKMMSDWSPIGMCSNHDLQLTASLSITVNLSISRFPPMVRTCVVVLGARPRHMSRARVARQGATTMAPTDLASAHAVRVPGAAPRVFATFRNTIPEAHLTIPLPGLGTDAQIT